MQKVRWRLRRCNFIEGSNDDCDSGFFSGFGYRSGYCIRSYYSWGSVGGAAVGFRCGGCLFLVGTASENKIEIAQAIDLEREKEAGKHHVARQAVLDHAFAGVTSHMIPCQIWGDRHCLDWTRGEVIVKKSDVGEQSKRSNWPRLVGLRAYERWQPQHPRGRNIRCRRFLGWS